MREFDGEGLFEKSPSPTPSSKTFRQIEEQGVVQTAKEFAQILLS